MTSTPTHAVSTLTDSSPTPLLQNPRTTYPRDSKTRKESRDIATDIFKKEIELDKLIKKNRGGDKDEIIRKLRTQIKLLHEKYNFLIKELEPKQKPQPVASTTTSARVVSTTSSAHTVVLNIPKPSTSSTGNPTNSKTVGDTTDVDTDSDSDIHNAPTIAKDSDSDSNPSFHNVQSDDDSDTDSTDSNVNNMANNLANFGDWADFAAANTQALIEGMNNLNAVALKKEIPEFTGELDEGITIDDWFKVADRVATTAGWTDLQKLRYFQDRLTHSAANFNETIGANIRATDYNAWRQLIIDGFQDARLRTSRKEQLKLLKQKQFERSRDFKKRIDDMYRMAYGNIVANSQDPQVIILRDEIKKDVFLNGVRSELASIIWGRLTPNATYEDTVTTAIQCEELLEVRRTTEAKNFVNKPSFENTTMEEKIKNMQELQSLIEQMRNLRISNNAGPVANIRNEARRDNYRVHFEDAGYRSRSPSPGYNNFRKPSYRPSYQNTRQRIEPSGRNNRPAPDTRTCYFCKHRGHIKRNCRKREAWARNNSPRRGRDSNQN